GFLWEGPRHRHEDHHVGEDAGLVSCTHASLRIIINESCTDNQSGGIMCIGGPALIYYVTPTEEELFLVSFLESRLMRRSLERRQEKQEDFDNFVGRLKEYSKSDKPIWTAWEKDVERRRAIHNQELVDAKRAEDAEAEARRQEIKGSI
ncbi:hypothetical protein EPUL_005588, partial [Erysiphe pulchra]